MAYTSHAKKSGSSQYDPGMLMVVVLLLSSILLSVAIKIFFPELLSGIPGIGSPATQQTVSIKPQPVTTVKDIRSQAASSAVAVKDERKNIKSVQAQANQKPVAKSVASDNKGHNELTCSENDRTAGLCN